MGVENPEAMSPELLVNRLENYKVPEDFSAEQLEAAGIVLNNFFEFNKKYINTSNVAMLVVESSMLIAGLRMKAAGNLQ